MRYSLLAGERALATYAWEDALAHCQRGLEAKEGQPVDAETAALLFGLGQAQAATLERHQLTEAVTSLSRAFDYYTEVGDVARAVAIVESTPRPGPGLRIGLAELVTRALSLVAPDSREAGYLLSRYGEVMARVEGDYDTAQEAFSRALAIAQREGGCSSGNQGSGPFGYHRSHPPPPSGVPGEESESLSVIPSSKSTK